MWDQISEKMQTERTGFLLLLGVVFIVVGFAPTIVAYLRRHPQRKVVAAVNLVGLMSWVAWVAVLVWAVTGRKSETIERLLRKRDRDQDPCRLA